MTESPFANAIPPEWTLRPMKRLLRSPLKYGANESGTLNDPECPRYIRITDFGQDGRLRDDTFASLPHDVAADYMLGAGDLLFARSGATVGKCYFYDGSHGDACFAGYLVKAATNRRKLHPRFLYHFTNSPDYFAWRDSSFTQATIENIGARRYGYMDIPVPPIDEQQRIADYLDASCEAIDRAVETKQKQLDTLEALRKSIIQKAVTQGLDPKVPMKDSEIDWLPNIPQHWTQSKLKRHVTLIRGQFTHRPRSDPAFYGGPYPFIQTGSVSATDKYITKYTQTLNERGLAVSRMFPAGTVVMTITGAKIAEVAVTAFEACFPDSMVGFIPDHHLELDFLFYLLKSLKPVLLRSTVVTTQPNINYVQIGTNYIPIPPRDEQQRIVEHIEDSMSKTSAIKKSLAEQIDTLNAYRKSLIHECVTGKRRISEDDVAKVKRHV